jgi:hypothetical protein
MRFGVEWKLRMFRFDELAISESLSEVSRPTLTCHAAESADSTSPDEDLINLGTIKLDFRSADLERSSKPPQVRSLRSSLQNRFHEIIPSSRREPFEK